MQLTREFSGDPPSPRVQHKVFLPSYEEWSLAVEREVAKNVVASLTYVGNHGYHEPVAQAVQRL